jgi:hypothetical protein
MMGQSKQQSVGRSSKKIRSPIIKEEDDNKRDGPQREPITRPLDHPPTTLKYVHTTNSTTLLGQSNRQSVGRSSKKIRLPRIIKEEYDNKRDCS